MNPRAHDHDDPELEPELELEPERYELHESGWSFDLGRRDFLGILGRRPARALPGQGRRGPGAGQGPAPGCGRAAARRRTAPARDRRLAAHRRGRHGHGLDRQGRGRPERPDLAHDGRGRRAEAAAGIGAHAAWATPTTSPSTWGPSAAGPRRPWSPRCAGRPPRPGACSWTWRPRSGASIAARSRPREARSSTPSTGRAIGFGELTKGRKLVETIGDGTADHARRRMEGRGPVGPQDRWPRLRDRTPPLHERPRAARHAPGQGPQAPGVRGAPGLARHVARRGDPGRQGGPRRRLRRGRRPQRIPRHPRHWPRSSRRGPRPTARPRPTRSSSTTSSRIPSSETGATGIARPVRMDSVKDELAAAHAKVEAVYTIAYIAHAPLEPRAAVAEWEGDRLTVWTGTQRPFGARSELAQAFHLAEDRVRVMVPDTGSGYGGKHTNEAAVEAARLARAAGKPVKLVWTREEEFTWAYFRPAGADRDRGRCRQGRQAHGLGVPQLQLRSARRWGRPTRCPAPRSSSMRRPRPCDRARTGHSPPRPTTSPASRSWTSWPMPRASTRWSSACGTWTIPGFAPCSKTPRPSSAGASRSPKRATASALPAARRRGDTSPPAPRSPWTRPRGRSRSSARSPRSSAARS